MNFIKSLSDSKNKSVKIIYIFAFIIFSVLTLIGALNHEIWFDEAQAWNIARDNDLAGIFRMMKHEGHPALWHIILHILSKLGVTASFLPLVSWFFSMITVGIILLKSPLHPVMNLSMMFSMGFLYANTVISRVYCILQFILVMLACIYPRRKEHPLLYGLCIALLANTHIVMWGLIGALGIYMIIDFFKECKKASKKENVLRITGIAIAGGGVLMLILPLIGCMTMEGNTSVAETTFTVKGIFRSLIHYTNNICDFFISFSKTKPINYFLLYILGIFILLIPVFMRHSAKNCIIFVSFMFGYFVASEVIWYQNVNRAALFILVVFITLWLIKTENNHTPKNRQLNLKMDSELLKKFIKTLINIDNKWYRSCCIILTGIMMLSFPAAFYNLFKDYSSYFSVEKAAADWINENISKDALIVSDNEGNCTVLAAYYPEYKFFSMKSNSYYTYSTHSVTSEEYEYEEIEKVLSDYDEVYYVSWEQKEYIESTLNHINFLFKKDGCMELLIYNYYFCIKQFDLQEFKEEKEALYMEHATINT